MRTYIKVNCAIEHDEDVRPEQLLKGLEQNIPGTSLIGKATKTKAMIDDIFDLEIQP